MILLRMTSRLVGLVAVVLALMVTATTAAAPSGPPIRIGGTLALTGPLAEQVQDGQWIVVWPKEFAAPGSRVLP